MLSGAKNHFWKVLFSLSCCFFVFFKFLFQIANANLPRNYQKNGVKFPLSMSLKKLKTIREIENLYDVFLVDVVGVVYDGKTPHPETIDTVNALIKKGKKVIFLSNMPRPGNLLLEKLLSFGVSKGFEVFTSGDATRIFLKENKNLRYFHLGAERNQDILEGIYITTVPSPLNAEAVLLTLFTEETEDPKIFDKILREIASLKIPVVCANPDKIAMHGSSTRICAGTYAEFLEKLGSKVLYFGKPNALFYALCLKKFSQDTPLKKILMVGDTVETDIKGAKNYGIDSLLVFTGNTGNEWRTLKKICAKGAEDFLKENFSVLPTYWMANLS